MTITREDLAAAAAVDLLQYRQIDPLLVFLLQRDVHARRAALAEQARRSSHGAVVMGLSYLAGLLAIVTAALFAALFTSRATDSFDFSVLAAGGILYALSAVRVASWFRQRGYCARVRVLAALALVSVPLAVLVVQQAAG